MGLKSLVGLPERLDNYHSPVEPNVKVENFGDRGFGLATTAQINVGEHIFHERVMLLPETDKDLHPSKYDALVLEKLKQMHIEFQAFFKLLPKAGDDNELDSPGAKFDRAGATERKFVSIRATKIIPKGEEVTVPYDFIHMAPAVRRQYMLNRFGFVCRCNSCDFPSPAMEECFANMQQDLRLISTQFFSVMDPAVFFQAVERLYILTIILSIRDFRTAQVLEQAARFAAYHSDRGRALAFLMMAKAQYSFVEGAKGPHVAWISKHEHDVSLIPGYGTKVTGQSKDTDVYKIGPIDRKGVAIACMAGIRKGRYLHLSSLPDRQQPRAKDTESSLKPEELESLIKTLEEQKKLHD
ncbi:conserved hypothetical protein [Microsporum canis CBS 113480]|uniref:SET domain-containing protein n=1 Tax=Arthroderma otae (strain ATCC MYA-4605 / CBS 113480) TaxID=554155 RepID=C5FPR6_ARTOC|nr:conserved hypothetical protein [Microsporum canis CBS 113480]EEQ31671.1 conserved hypothetical protein [Microsporum canis CBS 113480]